MKKILSGLLSLLVLCTSTLSVSAEDITVSYDSTVDESSTILQNVGVQAEAAEIFAVTLPKSVTLTVTGEGATSGYTVNVTGDIASNHYVRVIPLPDSKIKDADEVYAYDLQVTQDKKRWEHTELDGSVTADGTFTAVTYEDDIATPVILEPGKYEGIVQFALSCDDAGFWTPATCTTPATCSGYDTNDNGVLDWGEDANKNHTLDDGEDTDADGILATEYLATTVTRGSALGHKFADDDVAIPATCTRCKLPVYAIRTPEQLVQVANNVNSGVTPYSGVTLELANDIDMSGITDFSPIGTNDAPFKGSFNGNGYKIQNLNVKFEQGTWDKGILFGYVNAPSISNLTLKDSSLTITSPASKLSTVAAYGGLVGYVEKVRLSIDNVHLHNVNVNVASNSSQTGEIGLMVGYVSDSWGSGAVDISNCSLIGTINQTGTNMMIGRVWGQATVEKYACSIKNTFIATKVSGTSNIYPIGFTTYNNGDRADFRDAINTVVDSEYSGASAANALTTEQCKSQTALDILNTDSNYIWTLDLEGECYGYPIIK